MSRIIFVGDLSTTGFGTVTQDLGRALLAIGEDVRFVSQNDIGDLPEPFASRTLSLGTVGGWITMPRTEDEARTMNARIEGALTGGAWPDGWAAEAAIVIQDFFAIRRLPIVARIPDGFPVFHYVPIEGVDLPPSWAATWRDIRPVAMSQFGANEIERLTGKRPPVVYHGVDTDAFFRIDASHPVYVKQLDRTTGLVQQFALRSKADCKRFMRLDPNRVLVLRTDRHMPRKRYPSLLRALAPVMRAHPDIDFVYHCLPVDEGGSMPDLISKYPDVAHRMRSSGLHNQFEGVPREALNILYNAADVYASVSAEGFGLTIAEAMATGTPAIGIDYSSVPEVIGPGGIVVPIWGVIDNPYDHLWASANEDALGDAVANLAASRRRREQLGMLAEMHVRSTFLWSAAARQFADLVHAAVRTEVAA